MTRDELQGMFEHWSDLFARISVATADLSKFLADLENKRLLLRLLSTRGSEMALLSAHVSAAGSDGPKLAAATANMSAQEQMNVGTFIDTIKALFGSINWGCLISVLPQVIAAFANPALWVAVFTSYVACANPAGLVQP